MNILGGGGPITHLHPQVHNVEYVANTKRVLKSRKLRNTTALAKRRRKTKVKVSWLQGHFGLCGAYEALAPSRGGILMNFHTVSTDQEIIRNGKI